MNLVMRFLQTFGGYNRLVPLDTKRYLFGLDNTNMVRCFHQASAKHFEVKQKCY